MKKVELPDDDIHPQDFIFTMILNVSPSGRKRVCHKYTQVLRHLGRFDEAKEIAKITYKISEKGNKKKDEQLFKEVLLLFIKYYRRYKR